MNYNWDFSIITENYNILLRGLIGTLELASLSLLIGLSLGLLLGILRVSKNRLLDWPATAFIEIFRNTPVLVQLIWFFYAFPILVDIQMNAFTAATIAMSLNTAAYSAELYRGGIRAVDRGQWEAGRALGMSGFTLMRRIILPQAIRIMIPALTGRAIELTKMTALASTIAVGELLYQGKLISQLTFQPIETYTVVGLIYFIILSLGAFGVSLLEKRLHAAD